MAPLGEVTAKGCNVAHASFTMGPISLGGGQGQTSVSFIWAGICNFSGTVPFLYGLPSDEITVTGSNQLDGNCGAMSLSGSFSLTDEHGPVFIQ
jgi:hypothetical protein